MKAPFFIPPARIVAHIDRDRTVSLMSLLALAGVHCKASGNWTKRPVELVGLPSGEVIATQKCLIEREPGHCQAVRIFTPHFDNPRDAARWALNILAYGLMDLVARESIRGEPWTQLAHKRGRPRSVGALPNKERQRRHRTKAAARQALPAG